MEEKKGESPLIKKRNKIVIKNKLYSYQRNKGRGYAFELNLENKMNYVQSSGVN